MEDLQVTKNQPTVEPRNVLTLRTRMRVLTALNVEETTKNMSDHEIQQEKQQRWQKRIINELIESEKSYLRHLTLLEDFFIKPIQSQRLMTIREINVVFGQIESIVKFNGELLRQLTGDENQSVGNVFLEMAPFFKLYSTYANNFEGAISLIQRLEKENSKFLSFKRNQESRPEVNMTLNSLLIMPVQRVPRYKLLLDELMQQTPTGSDHCLLEEAIQLVDNATCHINECIREHENMQKMLAIQRNLLGGQPKIVVPGRQFIKEGWLMKVSRKGGKSHRRFFYLFNDMIVYCKQHSAKLGLSLLMRCCCVLPIKYCLVESLFNCGHAQGVLMKLTCMDETLLIYTDDVDEGESWVACIQASVQQYSEFRQTLRKESSAKRPTRRAAIKRNRNDSLTPLSKKRKLETLKSLPVPHFNSKFPLKEPLLVLRDCVSRCKSSRRQILPRLSKTRTPQTKLEPITEEDGKVNNEISAPDHSSTNSLMMDTLDADNRAVAFHATESSSLDGDPDNGVSFQMSGSFLAQPDLTTTTTTIIDRLCNIM